MCDSVWRGSRSHPQACRGAGGQPVAQGAGQSTPSWELEEGEPPGLARPLHQDASLMRPPPSQSGGA